MVLELLDAASLRAWRAGQGLKCAELAALIGVTRRTLWTWETGRANLPFSLPAQLAHIAAQRSAGAVLAPITPPTKAAVRAWKRAQVAARHTTMQRTRLAFLPYEHTEPQDVFVARVRREGVELFGVDVWEV